MGKNFSFNKKRVISLLKQVPELELKRKPLKRSRTRSTSIVESGRQAGEDVYKKERSRNQMARRLLQSLKKIRTSPIQTFHVLTDQPKQASLRFPSFAWSHLPGLALIEGFFLPEGIDLLDAAGTTSRVSTSYS